MTRRRVLAFDLDDTLAVTKSPITPSMSELLGKALENFDVCVISGGTFDQFRTQLLSHLAVRDALLRRLHLLPTSGTRYYRYDDAQSAWARVYSEDLSTDEKSRATSALRECAEALGLWQRSPTGEIIEDRGSQITYSALGQRAAAKAKYAWDPDGSKKAALRDRVATVLPDLSVRAGGTTSIDVTQKGVDKAYGMRKLMQVLDAKVDDILFFGDQLQAGGNDNAVLSVGIDAIAVRDARETEVAIAAIVAVMRLFGNERGVGV